MSIFNLTTKYKDTLHQKTFLSFGTWLTMILELLYKLYLIIATLLAISNKAKRIKQLN